jgi:SAM-dependent MidA family methyltransferase
LQFFETALPRALRQAPLGSIYEWRADSIALELGRRTRDEGAALIIDYGHAHSGLGDTLQAVFRHAFADPLRAPGTADLTAHVDFEALAHSAETIGARVHGPIRQRDLLLRLGIEQRAAALKSAVSQDKAAAIDIALSRLIAGGAIDSLRQPSANKNAMRGIVAGMGELFKAIAIAAPKLGRLPGFDTTP